MTRQTESDTQLQDGLQKDYDLVHDIAKLEGIRTYSIRFDDGCPLGCTDYHELDISACGSSVSVKLHHNEIEDFLGPAGFDLTQTKIRNAIDRLKTMLEG